MLLGLLPWPSSFNFGQWLHVQPLHQVKTKLEDPKYIHVLVMIHDVTYKLPWQCVCIHCTCTASCDVYIWAKLKLLIPAWFLYGSTIKKNLVICQNNVNIFGKGHITLKHALNYMLHERGHKYVTVIILGNISLLRASYLMIWLHLWQFLPRDSYAKRGICRRRVSVCVCVCVCVCLSVCHTPVLYQNG